MRAEACTELKFHLDSKALHKNFKYVGLHQFLVCISVDIGPIPAILMVLELAKYVIQLPVSIVSALLTLK